MKIKQEIIPKSRRNRPGHAMTPKYITVHQTANTSTGADARAHAKYLLSGAGGRSVSWHYTVDDTEVYQHLPTNESGWHAGDGAGPGNRQSIGVEICENGDGDFDKAVVNAQNLIRQLIDDHNIPIDNVVPHKKWTGKDCPRKLLSNWAEFVDGIKGKGKSTSTASSTSFTDLPAEEKYKEIEKAVNDVAVLQRQLMAVGENLSRYGDDGVPGAETLAAIQSFQRKHNISNPAGDNYGRPGPSTQAKLDDLINYTRLLRNQSPMMEGEDVRQVQRVVGTLADSRYGPNTANTVEQYQRKHNLGVDGIVGPETFGHMFG